MKDSIVITGMGIVSPIGNTISTFWENCLNGVSGVRYLNEFDMDDIPVHIAAPIDDFDPNEAYDNPKEARRASRFMQFQVYCAKKALENANIDPSHIDNERTGVIIGSGIGGIEIYEENVLAYLTKGLAKVSPFVVPLFITNQGPAEVARHTGFMGPNYSVSSACSTANHAIISACDQILLGRADIMLAGGVETPVHPMNLAAFSRARALSRRNDAPEKASRPFDLNRDGFVLGEGGSVFVLERESHAKARGAEILARIIGTGLSCDAFHMTAPREDGLGVKLAINMALNDANIAPQKIDYINAHGTSTKSGDIAECTTILDVFGDYGKKVKISSTKSMVGHALGGAAAIELAACIQTLRTGKIHPTINIDDPDPECPIDCVPNKAISYDVKTCMSNSFGFGGHNTSIIIEKV